MLRICYGFACAKLRTAWIAFWQARRDPLVLTNGKYDPSFEHCPCGLIGRPAVALARPLVRLFPYPLRPEQLIRRGREIDEAFGALRAFRQMLSHADINHPSKRRVARGNDLSFRFMRR
jgi:hypothetical protein